MAQFSGYEQRFVFSANSIQTIAALMNDTMEFI